MSGFRSLCALSPSLGQKVFAAGRVRLQFCVLWSGVLSILASVSLVLCRPAIMPFSLQGGPCSESTCNVCNICTQGFRLAHSGQTAQRTGLNLRFGNGLYFSSVSGKANDYAAGSEKVRQARFKSGQYSSICRQYNTFLTEKLWHQMSFLVLRVWVR